MEILIAGGLASLAVVAIVGLMGLKMLTHICKPNEVLIFSGRKYTMPDGTNVGYKVIHGGVGIQIPVFEKVDRMDLTTIPIEIAVSNAYSGGGIPLAVHAIANVKVNSDPRFIRNAIERFMGVDPAEIRRVAKESLEGHLRGVLARMTPEEVNEDRLKLTEELVEEAGEDFDRLGLSLDTLKVQSVSDDVEYLDSIGRERLANVLSFAEIAESTAKADAEEAQAISIREGKVANERAETTIRRNENALSKVKYELEARAKSAEERAEQQALTARARAERKLQEIRAKLEHFRLMSDVVLPAEAERSSAQMRARSEASSIVADGKAMAEVLDMMRDTWIEAGDDAKDIFLIQQLETVLSTVVDKVKEMEIGEVVLIDGGDGKALPNHIAALPSVVTAVLREFRETTGVDVTGILAGPQGVK
ncbi:MAG: flotillin [Myxococcota bacterium]